MPVTQPARMKLTPKQLKALRIIEEGRFFPTLVEEEDGWYARWRAVGSDEENQAVDGWVDEFVREAAMTRLTEDAEDQKHETLHDAWMAALKSRTGLVRWDPAACRAFASDLEEWSGYADGDVIARRGVVFRLRFACDGNVASPLTIVCGVPKGRRGLRALGQAAYVWGPLRGLKRECDGLGACDENGLQLSVSLTRSEAEDFIRKGGPELIQAGYGVEGLPERVAVGATAEVEDGSAVGRDAGVAPKLKLTVCVAGEPVTADEIRFLLDQGSTLVFFRDRWIEVDRNILKESLRALEKGIGKKPNLLSFAMGIGHVGALEIEELKAHGWVRGLVNELRTAGRSPVGACETPGGVGPHGLKGTLRPYQTQGLAWLRFMTGHGFGALLADDMGLGKTVQTIAWILAERTEGGTRGTEKTASARREPFLIVAPLTLLSNWKREFAAFAPDLRIYVHQGDRRRLASGFRLVACEADVVLTSYNLLVRDASLFSGVAWGGLVLDEAQAVKNPDTQVARAVRALSPAKRVALTGTPIENTVMDIWALEDFLNPGFLGDRKSFRDRFAVPIARDPNSVAAKRLRHALEPFILRRLKTDEGVAAELGEKREIREWCALGDSQRHAYEAALAAFRGTEHAPGDVFALLTELKLVCDGFVDGEGADPDACGKFQRLCDLLGAIFDAGESVLVFTQYAKVGAWLQERLAERFGRRFPFLHGALSPRAREAAIAAFNHGASVRGTAFILSLKAGGYGLNLTRATHVVHYDRWWNPAVENQATDRAHRIGQEKTVFVHLLVTEGTVEEHVDRMLADKMTLKDILADGQAFWKAVNLK